LPKHAYIDKHTFTSWMLFELLPACQSLDP